MKVKIKRGDDFIESTKVTIEIGDYSYRLSESIDGRLVINKISYVGDDDYVRVHPRSGNEIELS